MSFAPSESGAGSEKHGADATASFQEKSGTLEATASRSQALEPSPQPPSSASRVFADDELVAFRYRILRLLGSGGMGEVYEAEDLELRERVALKVLRRQLAERPGALELLKREVALARKVSHPNVCRLFDVGFHLRSSAAGSQRICFLTMELLPGEPLSSWLRRTGPLSHNEALPLVRQLAEGLGAAHHAGIIHRDFKSANVLLVPSASGTAPRAVITDFGLARALDEESSEPVGPTPRFVGTPASMAPEQLEGGPLTPSTDFYALGILLFELLTGTRPFQGEDPWSIATQRLHAPAPSPRRFRPELDASWEALVLHCLERQPARRFQHAREVVAALPSPQRMPALRRRLAGGARTSLMLLTVGLGGLLAGAPPLLPAQDSPEWHAAVQSEMKDGALPFPPQGGPRREEASATLNLTELIPEEDLRGRLQVTQEALALYREQGDRGGQCMALHQRSRYERELGELRGALRSAQEASTICRGTNQPLWEMNTLTHLGRAHLLLGELDTAEASFQEQLRIAREHQQQHPSHRDPPKKVAQGLVNLGDVALARGQFEQARKLYSEAREVLRPLMGNDLEKALALDFRMARLAWREGQLDEAARLAEEAVTTVAEFDVPAVHQLRGQIFLAQGLYKEANAALLQAGEPSVLVTQLGLRIQRARLSARRGGAPERQAALQSLQEVLAEAQKCEWLEGQYEARLALAELELAEGKSSGALSRLKTLERDARRKGWVLWAERAAAASVPPEGLSP
jgi:serine/threonine protein kinase/tetratricopeptide (TPR) repeat protein